MKLIIIGSPGSGKSVLSKKINKIINYPTLHLDKVYHTGGKSHISRSELIEKINDFTSINNNWIIDGNYISTIEKRISLADTIILLNLPTETCLENVIKRSQDRLSLEVKHEDMADNFDHTLSDEFVEFVKNFSNETFPKIQSILSNYTNKTIHIFSSYDEIDDFLNNLKL